MGGDIRSPARSQSGWNGPGRDRECTRSGFSTLPERESTADARIPGLLVERNPIPTQRFDPMAVQVKVTVKGKIPDVLAAVKAEAAKNKIKFNGDASKGTFAGEGIEGNYSISGQVITINVTKQPWYAPDSSVKSAIENWFKGK